MRFFLLIAGLPASTWQSPRTCLTPVSSDINQYLHSLVHYNLQSFESAIYQPWVNAHDISWNQVNMNRRATKKVPRDMRNRNQANETKSSVAEAPPCPMEQKQSQQQNVSPYPGFSNDSPDSAQTTSTTVQSVIGMDSRLPSSAPTQQQTAFKSSTGVSEKTSGKRKVQDPSHDQNVSKKLKGTENPENATSGQPEERTSFVISLRVDFSKLDLREEYEWPSP
ncbi:hypothetical protein ONS96_005293 [Cadophora gregata f. sp. sojae]|nr:hypothetical protein ONS96_005293 [Cadophora gregata f. sp. sojae]